MISFLMVKHVVEKMYYKLHPRLRVCLVEDLHPFM
jgi:hypothetical protein